MVPLPSPPFFRESNLDVITTEDAAWSMGGVLVDRKGHVRAIWASFVDLSGKTPDAWFSGLPAILIVSPEMVILERISGYQTEDKLLPILNTTLAKNQPVAPEPSHVASNPSPTPVRPVSSPKMTADNPFDVSQKVAAPAVYVEPSFGGLCLPGVNETRSLINGQPQFAMNYRGKTLHFSSQQQMQKFHAQPEKYWPMKDGACPVTLADNGQVAEGRLEYAAMFRGKLWFTSSPVQLKKFVASPARYVDAVQGQ